MSTSEDRHQSLMVDRSHWRVLRGDQSRQVDRYAIDQLNMSGLVLMENAGRGCVDVLCRQDAVQGVVVICGAGNNGGDGYVIARHLAIRQIPVRCIQIASAEKLPDDARRNLEIARQIRAIDFVDLSRSWSADRFQEALGRIGDQSPNWLVDALLGTGITGKLRPPYDEIVTILNRAPLKCLAVDLPTGLDCDAGPKQETIIRAKLTCTFVAWKAGLMAIGAEPFVGRVHVLDIGVPEEVIAAALAESSAQAS